MTSRYASTLYTDVHAMVMDTTNKYLYAAATVMYLTESSDGGSFTASYCYKF